MIKNFGNALDDFLMERMGEDIACLREENEKYKNALNEYSEIKQKSLNGGIDDYKQAFARLAELSEYIRDLENQYLYYSGMKILKKIDDTISSFDVFRKITE